MTDTSHPATISDAAATDHMRRHVTAVTRTVLGRTVMARGLAMTAGHVLGEGGVLRIAELAWSSGADLVHLDFALDGATPVLRDIIIAVPRHNGCHVHRGCRLAQRPGDRHAVLLPRGSAPWHLRVARDEIIQVRHTSADLVSEGVRFAARRLEQLVRDDVDVAGQIVVTEFSVNREPGRPHD